LNQHVKGLLNEHTHTQPRALPGPLKWSVIKFYIPFTICRKKWISDETFAAIRENRDAKGTDKKRYQELEAEVQKKL